MCSKELAAPAGPPPYFVIVDRALRDEGTSYHYARPSEIAEASPELVSAAAEGLASLSLRNVVGSSWTTDAPFRETVEAIEAARQRHSRGRNGSGGVDKHDGSDRRRFRKGRLGRDRRRARGA